MGIIFITTMIVIKPDIFGILKGVFVPTIPNGSIITVIALIGTTVVPYNFFIHSTAVHERFNGIKELKFARWDTIISITVGGIISAAILIAAATLIRGDEVKSIIQLSGPLKPVLGDAAPLQLASVCLQQGFHLLLLPYWSGSYNKQLIRVERWHGK